jgi:SAM-dependent methyltransferase
MPEPRALLELIEGHQLARLLLWFLREGILEQLVETRSAAELAQPRGMDEAFLDLALAYAAERSDVVEVHEGGYRLAAGRDLGVTTFLLEQYLGAYGPNLQRLDRVARDPACAGELVDRSAHAAAFDAVDRPSFSALPQVVGSLGLSPWLDLACGTGTLLAAVGREQPRLTGWGVDASEAMCARARARLAAAGLGERFEIVEADALASPESVAETCGEAAVLTAASLVNELFTVGTTRAVEWLTRLRAGFPGRLLVVADYYGQLGHATSDRSWHTLLHDFVQLISGQGVPPPDREAWAAIYEAAGCQLAHAYEGEGAVRWFVHLVALPH